MIRLQGVSREEELVPAAWKLRRPTNNKGILKLAFEKKFLQCNYKFSRVFFTKKNWQFQTSFLYQQAFLTHSNALRSESRIYEAVRRWDFKVSNTLFKSSEHWQSDRSIAILIKELNRQEHPSKIILKYRHLQFYL